MALPYKSAISVSHRSSFNPHKTLGHHIAPAGPGKTQHNILLEKATSLFRHLATAPADRRISFLFYFSLYLPSIGYVIRQCFYTPAKREQIESKSMPLIFAKCGYNRNSPKILMYGHPSLSGGGFIRLYTIQGEGQIQLFLKFWRTQSEISQVLRITLAWCQYQAGTSKPVLEHPKDHIPYLEARWLPSLRNGNSGSSASATQNGVLTKSHPLITVPVLSVSPTQTH
jgi:hypothetical protein